MGFALNQQLMSLVDETANTLVKDKRTTYDSMNCLDRYVSSFLNESSTMNSICDDFENIKPADTGFPWDTKNLSDMEVPVPDRAENWTSKPLKRLEAMIRGFVWAVYNAVNERGFMFFKSADGYMIRKDSKAPIYKPNVELFGKAGYIDKKAILHAM